MTFDSLEVQTMTVAVRYCPVCRSLVSGAFAPGPGGRPDASCPTCRSLERQRFLALLLAWLRPTLGRVGTILDIAPSEQVTPLLAALDAEHYVRLDLGADSRLVDVMGSITDLPVRSDSVDLMVCYHVLEHVPNDRRAMREIARVLRPGGLALLQVPWRPERKTDEDPDAPVEARIERFGQADHVRFYGDDFEARLQDAGLAARRVIPEVLLGTRMCKLFKVLPWEWVWLATPAGDGPADPVQIVEAAQTTSLTDAFDHVMDLLEDADARVADSTGALERNSRELKRLRARVEVLQRREALAYRLARRLPAGIRRADGPLRRLVKR